MVRTGYHHGARWAKPGDLAPIRQIHRSIALAMVMVSGCGGDGGGGISGGPPAAEQ